MIVCVDVDYREVGAVAACVCFQAWSDDTSVLESVVQIREVEPYQSGQFYRRELPCILAVLKSLPELPQVIIIDGYVWLGERQPGLAPICTRRWDDESPSSAWRRRDSCGRNPWNRSYEAGADVRCTSPAWAWT